MSRSLPARVQAGNLVFRKWPRVQANFLISHAWDRSADFRDFSWTFLRNGHGRRPTRRQKIAVFSIFLNFGLSLRSFRKRLIFWPRVQADFCDLAWKLVSLRISFWAQNRVFGGVGTETLKAKHLLAIFTKIALSRWFWAFSKMASSVKDPQMI